MAAAAKKIDTSNLGAVARQDADHDKELAILDDLLKEQAFQEFIASIEFQGYDPELIFAIMTKIEPDNKKLMADALKLITFVMVRGTRWTRERIKSSMSIEVWRRFDDLCQKYGISESTPVKKEDINLSRVVGAFPHIAASVMAKATQARIVGEVPLGAQRLRPLCFPGSASLIPRTGKEADDLFESMMPYWVGFDAVVKASSQSRASRGQSTAAADPAAVKKYAEISRNSKILSDKSRAAILKKLGVW